MGEVIRANRSTVVTTRHGHRVAVVAGKAYDGSHDAFSLARMEADVMC